MVNTEKPMAKAEQKKQAVVQTPKKKEQVHSAPAKKENTISEVKTPEEAKDQKKAPEVKKVEKKKVKKEKSVINATSVPISTKYSIEICRFIKNKTIEDAIKYLEKVLVKKEAIPMRGEYGHKKGKGMAGGKYPQVATKHFIKLLKSLSSNATADGIDEPFIFEAIANMSARPMGRFGRWKRKRTHIKLVAKEMKKSKNKTKKEAKK